MRMSKLVRPLVGLAGAGVTLASGCDATQLREVGNGLVSFADIVDPQPEEQSLGEFIDAEVEDFFDDL